MHHAEAKLDNDGDGPQRRLAAHMENTLEKTERQVQMLCRTFSTVAEFTGDTKSPTEGTETPRELQEKATKTCVLLLHQLDNIVEDMARWTAQPSVLEKNYAALLKASAERQEADCMNARIASMPSSRLPVHLHEYAQGQWGAYLLQNGSAVLIGKGPTIQDALNDFNMIALKGEQKLLEEKPRQPKKKKATKANGPTSKKSPEPSGTS